MVFIKRDKNNPLVKKIKKYLQDQQFTEKRNIPVRHPAYGGWGFGETRLAKGEAGHADLSHTRRILQALQMAGLEEKSIFEKAVFFLKYTQKDPADSRPQPGLDSSHLKNEIYDGGFYYSPVVLAANKGKIELLDKAKPALSFYRSYATATCDGLLSLLAIGKNTNDREVNNAIRWLTRHPKLEYPEGIPTDDQDEWYTVMKFYHWAVRAEAYRLINFKGENWQKELWTLLKKEQKEDGSFANPKGARNKEDDPYLASTFALIALLNTVLF